MARAKNNKQKKSDNGANVGYEAELWQMADALRGSMNAAEYKHVVLGLIFLKYISDAFEEQHAKLEAEKAQGAEPEDPDEYRALNIFWVPPEARWSHLKAQAKQPTIGQLVDDAMTGIERDNPSLKGVLPKDYARPGEGPLSLRRNIVVIADEAHRSQYDFIDGFARHMRDALPNASFIGFTGTPIELTDKNTRAVFGDYISIYDIQRAVEDKATVPIYYESRLAKLDLNEAERPKIDPDFEEATEGEEVERKEKLKSKWAQLEAIVGAGKRLKLIAQDIVDHFEQRAEAMLRQTQDEGKAMIVCMSRRICVELCGEIVKLRPHWHDDNDEKGINQSDHDRLGVRPDGLADAHP